MADAYCLTYSVKAGSRATPISATANTQESRAVFRMHGYGIPYRVYMLIVSPLLKFLYI